MSLGVRETPLFSARAMRAPRAANCANFSCRQCCLEYRGRLNISSLEASAFTRPKFHRNEFERVVTSPHESGCTAAILADMSFHFGFTGPTRVELCCGRPLADTKFFSCVFEPTLNATAFSRRKGLELPAELVVNHLPGGSIGRFSNSRF